MITLSIKGDKWKVFIFDSEEFISKFGDGMSAFADITRKQIFFDSSELTVEVVRHEIFHCYVSYLHLESATLDTNQVEEIFAEMFSIDAPIILKQSSSLYKKLKKLE